MATSGLAAVVRHIRAMAADPRMIYRTDGDLLRAYLRANDQAAFQALVRRHGKMVLRICRGALGNMHDAEDAFQATFLVLARRANSIRKKESLASWLHGVAYRMALNARKVSARRRKHELQAKQTQSPDPALTVAWHELQLLLNEEIEHLPEYLRSPFVLCCLENKSHADAARELGIKETTIGMRLSRARKRLQERLSRRGVSFGAVLAASAVGVENAAGVPASLVYATAQAAKLLATGQMGVGGLVSARVAALTEGVLKRRSLDRPIISRPGCGNGSAHLSQHGSSSIK